MMRIQVILPPGVVGGQVVQVKTMWGPVSIRVPPNAQGGSALVLDIQPPAQAPHRAAAPPQRQQLNNNNTGMRQSGAPRRSDAIMPTSRSAPSVPAARHKQNKYSESSSNISHKVKHEKGPLDTKEGYHT